MTSLQLSDCPLQVTPCPRLEQDAPQQLNVSDGEQMDWTSHWAAAAISGVTNSTRAFGDGAGVLLKEGLSPRCPSPLAQREVIAIERASRIFTVAFRCVLIRTPLQRYEIRK